MRRDIWLLALLFALGAFFAPSSPVNGGQLLFSFGGTVNFNPSALLMTDEPGSLVGMPFEGSFTINDSGPVSKPFQVGSFELSFPQLPASPLVKQGAAKVERVNITLNGQPGKQLFISEMPLTYPNGHTYPTQVALAAYDRWPTTGTTLADIATLIGPPNLYNGIVLVFANDTPFFAQMTMESLTITPEPSTIGLLGCGTATILCLAIRRRRGVSA
jgi:hypothetical protein